MKTWIFISGAATSILKAMQSTGSLDFMILSTSWLLLHHMNKLSDRCYMFKCCTLRTDGWIGATHTHRDLKLQTIQFMANAVFFSPLPSFRNHCSQIWATTHWQTSRSRRRLDAASSVRCTGRGTCSTTRRSPWRKFRWAGNNEEELFFSPL